MDLDVGVQRAGELKDWLPKDPLVRVRKELEKMGMITGRLGEIDDEVRAEVDAAISFARRSPFPNPSELMNHVFFSAQETA